MASPLIVFSETRLFAIFSWASNRSARIEAGHFSVGPGLQRPQYFFFCEFFYHVGQFGPWLRENQWFFLKQCFPHLGQCIGVAVSILLDTPREPWMRQSCGLYGLNGCLPSSVGQSQSSGVFQGVWSFWALMVFSIHWASRCSLSRISFAIAFQSLSPVFWFSAEHPDRVIKAISGSLVCFVFMVFLGKGFLV
jgi:hypothetical protein